MLFSIPTEKILEKEQRQIFLRRLFRRVFLEDWGTKLIALGIAFALWLGVTGLRPPITRRITNVPLNLNYSGEVDITNSPVSEVDIDLTGDKGKIERLRREDLVISVDLTDIKTGERMLQLTPENISVELPNGVKIDRIQPDKIAVKLEKVAEREVPVTAETEGNLPENFEIYSKTVTPANVRVRGPESFVRALDSISTEEISLENKKEEFTERQVELNLVNPKIRLLDTAVDVTFKIGEKRIEKYYSVEYEKDGQKRRATVGLLASRTILETIKPDDLTLEFKSSENGASLPHLVLPETVQSQIEVKSIKLN